MAYAQNVEQLMLLYYQRMKAAKCCDVSRFAHNQETKSTQTVHANTQHYLRMQTVTREDLDVQFALYLKIKNVGIRTEMSLVNVAS